ncbi:hypothetical protein FRB93_002918 [Tulasnella sp. JGI-2019a]|nr:hypothetical protein FRB93_002918 [Tulasnella sp. JGI-2019a]
MGKDYSPWVASSPYIVGSFACIGGGLFGLDISSMAGVITNPSYISYFHNPNSNAQGAIVASMPAGSLVGALAVTVLADWLGRKKTVILSGIIWVIGAILQAASQNRGMLVVGRIIAGISIGIASSVVPMYQAEITAPAIRGRLVSLQQWAITWGILLQFFVQFGCSYINGIASIRIPWALQTIPAVLLSVGMMWFPESPRWLMDKGLNDRALEILADVHGGGDPNNALVQLEYNEIKGQIDFERQYGAKRWGELFEGSVFRRVVLGVSLQMWSQLTGMNVMMYYITIVFEGAGLTGRRGNLIASSVQYVLNVVMTIPAIIYIDKWGRRPMLLIGLAFMAFWLFLVGGLQGHYGHWAEIGGARVWAVDSGQGNVTRTIIVASYLFVCSFALTMGPVSWTYPSEIFPMRVRAKAISLSTASNWVFNFALAYAVPPGLASISFNVYFIFATCNVLAFFHVLFMYPETKGRTLEEVEEVFAVGHTFQAWKIGKDVGRRHSHEVAGGREHKAGSVHSSSDEKVTAAHREEL